MELVDLVYGQQNVLFAAAQDLCHFLVHGRYPGLGIGHQQDHRRFVDGQVHLFGDLVLEDIVRPADIPAGVDHRKFQAVPVAFSIVAVAGYTRNGVHDGLPRLGQAVEKRRFAHVRPSDDSQDVCHILFCSFFVF